MYLGIDLGSTNIKAALYDLDMCLKDCRSISVDYIRENGFVEFDAQEYTQNLIQMLCELLTDNKVTSVCEIAFTGQAESLIVLDKDSKPLMNAISWMDERSKEECEELKKFFSDKECEMVTGQQAILPTWPATKVLWIKKNKAEIFEKANTYILLKDFVVYYFTGKMFSDMSIATFSFYFDIYKKCYWKKMLDAIGITEENLPPLTEPCTAIGTMKESISQRLGLSGTTKVNVGTLDHFAGMIGTGNISEGKITLSTGTVMAMATFSKQDTSDIEGIAMHYGFVPDTHIMLPVCESGGVSLEWFRSNCMKDISFKEIDDTVCARGRNGLIFLPYLVGSNSPEFDSRASGVFWGLRGEHDAFDMAYAVMEGVGFLLKKNCEYIEKKGSAVKQIIATGGGSKSAVWCRLMADITGLPVLVPKEKDAACLGAAIIAAVSDGRIESYEEATRLVEFEKTFEPSEDNFLEKKYIQFCKLYDFSVVLNSD